MDLKSLITIVIPCKNEGDQLIKTVSLIDDRIKIIVADVSTDNTIDLLRDKFTNRKIKIVKGGLPAIGRNKGAKLVKTPYVLFLDADVMMEDKNILSDCLKAAMEKKLDLVTVRFTVNDSLIYKFVYLVFDLIQRITSISTPFAVGGFMLFDMRKFNKLGGFDPEDKFAEDYHLSSKVDPKKFSILNSQVVTTSRRFKNKGLFYMLSMMIRCWINRNDDNFYRRDYGYWD